MGFHKELYTPLPFFDFGLGVEKFDFVWKLHHQILIIIIIIIIIITVNAAGDEHYSHKTVDCLYAIQFTESFSNKPVCHHMSFIHHH